MLNALPESHRNFDSILFTKPTIDPELVETQLIKRDEVDRTKDHSDTDNESCYYGYDNNNNRKDQQRKKKSNYNRQYDFIRKVQPQNGGGENKDSTVAVSHEGEGKGQNVTLFAAGHVVEPDDETVL